MMQKEEHIVDLLENDPAIALDMLVDEIKGDYTRRTDYFKILALKSVLNTSTDELEKLETLKKVQQLGKEIINQKQPLQKNDQEEKELEKQAEEKRNYYLLKGSPSRLLLEAKNLFKTYKGGNFKMEDISLSLRFGEITGLVGENGNGKTTLLKIIAGELLQDAGELSFSLTDNNRLNKDWGFIKSNMAYLPQELPKIPGTMIEALRFTAAVHGFWGKRNNIEVQYIIQRLNLSDHLYKTWHKLSGGYKLRFSLAKMLLRKPKIIIMDEPLASLDIRTQNNLLNDLRELCNSINDPITILFSSQHIDEVEAISDKIILLSRGKQIFYGLTDDIGKLRKQNTYEIKTRLLQNNLIEALSEFNYNSLTHTGLSYLLNTNLETSMNMVMEYFSQKNIPVQSVKDISNSTREFLLRTGEN